MGGEGGALVRRGRDPGSSRGAREEHRDAVARQTRAPSTTHVRPATHPAVRTPKDAARSKNSISLKTPDIASSFRIKFRHPRSSARDRVL
jgi:hypothetical protein